ncbi:4-hydroxy-tetrahydrodipicolinate synthase [Halobacteriovorax sp. JY17]|uniref:4-hydroxy-tetrahydrodipicolinate synthase n=1 Tax=Halobacteriovorax sp. JY17 TaxID=2014617 RepID=UPI000C3E9F0E|nr:4-hydroxy-tetrahydrodipicolinate synthase [Halobacteriovorax sp. JY17]PIK15724.1 MAG: 4-hydroxy-tetrahydrodipicolinate synthase [Halobacteriovorax sp. JY17]
MNLNEYKLWTAVITPMKADGSVHYEDLTKVLRDQESAGNGILILGSTGESLNLDEDEKVKILEHTLSLGLTAPIMVGVGGINLNQTRSWVDYLETLDVHAYLLVTPLYAKPGKIGQYEWFKSLLESSSRPCMLYNVPGRTGVKMSFEAIEMLKDHPNFWAIKEASGSTEDFAKYVAAAPKALVYSGDDAMLPDYTPLGAKGLVSVASNVWAKKTHLYVTKALANELNADEKKLWNECSNSLFMASNPIPVKRLMQIDGQISTNVLRAPLTHKEIEDDSILRSSHSKINEWN